MYADTIKTITGLVQFSAIALDTPWGIVVTGSKDNTSLLLPLTNLAYGELSVVGPPFGPELWFASLVWRECCIDSVLCNDYDLLAVEASVNPECSTVRGNLGYAVVNLLVVVGSASLECALLIGNHQVSLRAAYADAVSQGAQYALDVTGNSLREHNNVCEGGWCTGFVV